MNLKKWSRKDLRPLESDHILTGVIGLGTYKDITFQKLLGIPKSYFCALVAVGVADFGVESL